eukprot:04109_4
MYSCVYELCVFAVRYVSDACVCNSGVVCISRCMHACVHYSSPRSRLVRLLVSLAPRLVSVALGSDEIPLPLPDSCSSRSRCLPLLQHVLRCSLVVFLPLLYHVCRPFPLRALGGTIHIVCCPIFVKVLVPAPGKRVLSYHNLLLRRRHKVCRTLGSPLHVLVIKLRVFPFFCGDHPIAEAG